ncbi:hypothetical protein FHS27_001979 [Rhodopirellula rubra]|uniref:Uncharacterized protein n=1 Tax=Aporhodopirellula rubra TaxID=980271 RepID=A0A7W5DX66_9BACT|nr:hypothetical protein [Aporhodopirellula rubra]
MKLIHVFIICLCGVSVSGCGGNSEPTTIQPGAESQSRVEEYEKHQRELAEAQEKLERGR